MFKIGEQDLVITLNDGEQLGDFNMVSVLEKEVGGREDDHFYPVSASERHVAMDAVSLLGGNEYLVQQLLQAGVDARFTAEQEAALHLTMGQMWGEGGVEGYTSQDSRLGLLFPQHRERLPHILASSLLYCSRHQDTRLVYLPSDFPDTRLLILNMSNYMGADPPIGRTPGGSECSRLAVLYHWAGQRDSGSDSGCDTPTEEKVPKKVEPEEKPAGNKLMVRVPTARRLSNSLALEKRMMDVMDVFAIFPCP